MITWERTHYRCLECFVGNWYGVVGLTQHSLGWTARVEGPTGPLTSPVLYHTVQEAQAWVEQQINAVPHSQTIDLMYGRRKVTYGEHAQSRL